MTIKKNKNAHQLYKTGDEGAPEAIKDRNGEVCLAHCKVCNKGESQLDGQPYCTPNKNAANGELVELKAISAATILFFDKGYKYMKNSSVAQIMMGAIFGEAISLYNSEKKAALQIGKPSCDDEERVARAISTRIGKRLYGDDYAVILTFVEKNWQNHKEAASAAIAALTHKPEPADNELVERVEAWLIQQQHYSNNAKVSLGHVRQLISELSAALQQTPPVKQPTGD